MQFSQSVTPIVKRHLRREAASERRNAEAIAQGGAAGLVPQAELTPERLTAVITQLFANPPRLKQMAERARALSHHDAAGRVARMVAELAGTRV